MKNTDQKLAALGGIMAALTVSLAFQGEGRISLLNHLQACAYNLSASSFRRCFSGVAFQKKEDRFIPLKTAPDPDIFDRSSNVRQMTQTHFPSPESTSVSAILPSENHKLSDQALFSPSADTVSSGTSNAAGHQPGRINFSRFSGICNPYFYHDGHLIGRIPQDKKQDDPESALMKNCHLHQINRHLGKNLKITLTLKLPSQSSPEQSAVIFSQKIPDGWKFTQKKGCIGWHMKQDHILKFLATPEDSSGNMKIDLLFSTDRTDAPPPQIAKATCAIQHADGSRKLYHAEY